MSKSPGGTVVPGLKGAAPAEPRPAHREMLPQAERRGGWERTYLWLLAGRRGRPALVGRRACPAPLQAGRQATHDKPLSFHPTRLHLAGAPVDLHVAGMDYAPFAGAAGRFWRRR